MGEWVNGGVGDGKNTVAMLIRFCMYLSPIPSFSHSSFPSFLSSLHPFFPLSLPPSIPFFLPFLFSFWNEGMELHTQTFFSLVFTLSSKAKNMSQQTAVCTHLKMLMRLWRIQDRGSWRAMVHGVKDPS